MSSSAGWDWETREKIVADINEWNKKFTAVRELIPSDDGEKVAGLLLRIAARIAAALA